VEISPPGGPEGGFWAEIVPRPIFTGDFDFEIVPEALFLRLEKVSFAL
jgi:hypothetical protein